MGTKEKIKVFVKTKLSSDTRWALKALLEIYKFQTREEQQEQETIDANGVGFSGTDGLFLSSLAEQYKSRGSLSEKQLQCLLKKMPKYWNQVVRISDEQKLMSLIS